jgi:AcrR family transcriptional regulator
MGSAREDLLQGIVADVAVNGISDRSLRELATAVGSSHRMLLYHFGSREGLVEAIVAEVERSQRDVLLELVAETTDPSELVRRLWARVSSPELRPFVRLFFESLAYPSKPVDADRTAPWLDAVDQMLTELGMPLDPAEIRLGIAVTRGLLVDVVVTGDVESATAALERFVRIWEVGRAHR